MAFSYVNLTGQWANADGSPATGFVTAIPSQTLTNGTTSVSDAVRVSLDTSGAVNFAIAATSDVGTVPVNSTYTLYIQLAGRPVKTIVTTIPPVAGLNINSQLPYGITPNPPSIITGVNVTGSPQPAQTIVATSTSAATWESVMRFLGAWQANTVYYPEDVVTINNIVYVCTAEHNSGTAFTTANWNQLGIQELPLNSQILSAVGAVVFNALLGNTVVETLEANATSSSIVNGVSGQNLTIQWLQDATGLRTYVWPTNCKFAGGTAPVASTLAGYRDSVSFVFDGSNWFEISRSIGIH